MADVKSCTINDKIYWRCIYENGDRYYCVETKRRNQYGLSVKRQITAQGTKYRIDAELAGGLGLVKEFLSAWLAWAETGARRHKTFHRCGLCGNLSLWLRHKGLEYADRRGIEVMFQNMLPGNTMVKRLYPFGGPEVYQLDGQHDQHHTNEKRLTWVREKLK